MNNDRLEVLMLIDDICEQFEKHLKQHKEVEIADWVKLVSKDDRPELFLELLRLETHHSANDAYKKSIGEYFRVFPEYSHEIVKVFASNRESDLGESNSATQASADFSVAGDRVDRFEIISVLGAGGSSVVYLARDPERTQSVALKLLNTQSGPRNARNFECIVNEANVLSCIDNPSIPQVFDVGETDDGRPWVAMEFIKGESLYKSLATDDLSLVEVLKVLRKTAEALHEVHEAGFSHRDIKPDNIIIGLDGEPRILDFGLALHENLQRDKSGERAGTTAFMSPEQVQGQSEDLDGRTDIWSLGVILYLVIAKRMPFDGDTKEDIRRDIVMRPVKPPRQIKNNTATVELENICFRALSKAPEDRFSTAKDFANSLQLAIDVLPTEFLLQDASRHRTLTNREKCTIRLARKARLWNAQPGSENLPGFVGYVRFRTQTDRSLWTDSESALMAATAWHFRQIALVTAILVGAFFAVRFQLQRMEQQAKIRDVVTMIGQTPISEVESVFDEQSSFAREKCLDAIRSAFLETANDEDAIVEHIRYAIILSPTQPEFQEQFKMCLIDGRTDEIETLSKLVFANEADDFVPALDEEWLNKLTSNVSTASFVPGIENIWQETPVETIEKFESMGGQLAARYAFCTRMKLEDFKQIAEEFREYRYRPECIRPWVNGKSETMVAAIWHRSSSDWEITWELSPLNFMELKSRNSMHLVDVSNGLEAAGEPPSLVAVWSNEESPYGRSRQMLLAERIPQLVDPQWDLDEKRSHAVISKDIGTDYLANSPLLADVFLHFDISFTPSRNREKQKLSVGEMIVQEYQSDHTSIAGSPDFHGIQAGDRMKIQAYDALGQFEDSSDHFLQKTEKGGWPDLPWPELWIRSLSFAKADDWVSAHHAKSLLQKKMNDACRFKAKPYIPFGVAQAIDLSVDAEMDFWKDGDATKFIIDVNRRIQKVEACKSPRECTPWAEYYALALASSSVSKAVSASHREGSEKNALALEKLIKKLVEKCINLKPSMKKVFAQRHVDIQAANGSVLTSIFLNQEIMPIRSSAWSSLVSNFESRFVEPRNAKPHAAMGRQLDDRDFFPISIVFGIRTFGNPKIGSIWHRELDTLELAHREQRLANSFCYALHHNEDIGIWKILESPNTFSLKQRIIDTLLVFKVNIAILLDRLDNSDNSNERLSILESLRHYSNGHVASKDIPRVLLSLNRIERIGAPREKELAKIIRLNLSPIQTASAAKLRPLNESENLVSQLTTTQMGQANPMVEPQLLVRPIRH